jgi:hypothetical protein
MSAQRTAEAPPVPSQDARDLVRGGIDLHVHLSPDVVGRRIDDLGLARRCQEVGLAGFLLKSHYTSTAERASVVSAAVPGISVIGAIVLNQAIGGVNPVAVEIAAREGARKLWMPTVDSVNEREHLARMGPDGNLPVWAKLEFELRERGIGADPVLVLDEDGKPLPETMDVLGLAADHGMVVATGHLSGSEALTIVDAALERGVESVVLTHPDYPGQSIPIEKQVEMAERGAMIERCFTTPYTGKCTWEQWLAGAKAVGAERTIIASDMGQVKNPPVEDGLPLMAEKLLEFGFSEDEVRTMAVDNTRRLAGVEAL